MHRFPWNDLQFVHAVAEHGSLSAAARTLGVNHSTVQRRITLLEANTGIELFERGRHGYRLRPEGRDVLASLRLMETAAERIGSRLAMSGKGVTGSFRLTTTDSIANILLPKYLESLRDVHPNAHIEIAVSNTPTDMSQPVAEISIRAAHNLPSDLDGEHAGDVAFQAFGTPEYLANNPGTTIEAHHWLGVMPNFAQSTAGTWQASRIADSLDITADSFLTLASLAERGLGLAMLPAFVGRNSGLLERAPHFPSGPSIGLWVAAHPDIRCQNHIAALVEFFIEAIRSDAVILK